MQRLVSSDNYNLAMLDFYKNVVPNQKADEAFQANKYTRWSLEQAANYMSSTATGKAPSKFILCDIEKCLESAIQDERPSDIEYYKDWLAMGVKYLNLDSNNRCINVTDFYQNKVAIESDHYRLGDMIVLVEKGLNDTYDKLPKKLKEAFDNAVVSVQMYTDVTRQELSDIFTRLNDGKPLNEPEKRNASTSLVAQAVRELASEYYSVFTHKNNKWFTDEQGNRRGPDDEVAKMLYLFVNGHSANVSSVKSLKKMYEIKSKEEDFIRQFKSIFKAFMKWHEDEQVFALPKNSVFDLWIIFLKLKNDENAKIKDGKLKSFIKLYCKIVGNLLADETIYDREAPLLPGPFSTMIGGKQPGNNLKRHELIWPKIEEVFDTYFVSLDPKRSITPNERLSTAARDDFMTPEKKEIDLSKLNDGETYHGGHKEAHTLGNPTTVDNSVIQEATDNLKNGKNPVKV
tara:strand:- start:33 stop:1406 length:1374 start_codon:yes stop_codon:yes gene_type:complete